MSSGSNAKDHGTRSSRADTPRLVADNRGLVASNLGKAFKKRPVLRDVSLSLQRGEVVGECPSGSTLYFVICFQQRLI